MKKNIVLRPQNTLKCGLVTLIALAFLLSANQSGAAVGDSFTDANFKYTVLTEEGTAGTVSVAKQTTTIPSGAVAIPSSVTNGSITYSVTSIGELAFYHCRNLTSVVIGNGVTHIGKMAFDYCNNLRSITIPDSVTSIGNQAFQDCWKLTSVVIGDGVTHIGEDAFIYCKSLTEIEVAENNPEFSSKEGVLFNKDQTTLIQFPGGKKGDYTIPNSVSHVVYGAFWNCSSLASVTIPDSVTSIGDRMFYECSSLTSITIPDSVTSIGELAFYCCSSLASVTIPDSVTSIGESAFQDCWKLTSVVIGDGVTSIGLDAFCSCSNLTSVVIGKGVTHIGGYAFLSCRCLKAAYFKGDAPEFGNEVFTSDPILYYIERTSGWTTPTWNGYRTAVWIPVEPPAVSFEVKEGKLTLNYGGGSLEASSDLILWSPVEGAQEGKYEVDLPKTGKLFYRVAQ